MGPKRVVILEDIASMRDILVEVVEAEGHQVAYAGAEPGCVERVLADPPDLLFLDLSLKARLGVDVYAVLRADPRTQDLPVIICTVQRSQTVARKLHAPEDARLRTLYQPFAIADAQSMMRALLAA
ncbi:MAG: response regulator [Elusimicrobia bacterium]|nr:response regulator [Elusimicrobiota bacterium]